MCVRYWSDASVCWLAMVPSMNHFWLWSFMCAYILTLRPSAAANLQEKRLWKDGGSVDGASLQCIIAFSYVCQVLKSCVCLLVCCCSQHEPMWLLSFYTVAKCCRQLARKKACKRTVEALRRDVDIVRIAFLMQEGRCAIFEARKVTCCIRDSMWCAKLFIAFRM